MEDILVLDLPTEAATLESASGINSKHVFLTLARLVAVQQGERDNLGNWWFGAAHICFFLVMLELIELSVEFREDCSIAADIYIYIFLQPRETAHPRVNFPALDPSALQPPPPSRGLTVPI